MKIVKRILLEKILLILIFIAFCEGCEEGTIKQLRDQNIDPQCEQGLITVNGTNHSQSLNLYLNLNQINITETNFKMIFVNFTQLTFSSLSIHNLIQSDKNFQEIITIKECKNLTIDYLDIQQIQNQLVDSVIFLYLMSNRFQINNGIIQYTNPYNQDPNVQQSLIRFESQLGEVYLNNLKINIDLKVLTTCSKLIRISSHFQSFSNFTIDIFISQFDKKYNLTQKYFENSFISTLYSEGFNNTSQFDNFIINIQADRFYPIEWVSFIILEYPEKATLKNFSISIQKALINFIEIRGDDRLKDAIVEIDGITFHNSVIQNNPYLYSQSLSSQTFISIRSITTCKISNVFVSNVQIEQYTFFSLDFIENISYYNINFSNNLNQVSSNLLHCGESQPLSWSKSKIFFSMNTELTKVNINKMNIEGLSINQDGSIFFFSSTIQLDLLNISIYIDGIIKTSLSPFFYINRPSPSINIIDLNIIINAKTSFINLYEGSFLYFTDILGDSDISVNKYSVEVINYQENPSFVIYGNGPFFKYMNAIPIKQSKIKLNQITAKNIKVFGHAGFGQFIGISYLELDNSEFQGISSQGDGGVFHIFSQNLNISNTSFSECSSSYFGGALFLDNLGQEEPFDFNQVTISSCQALFGGGIASKSFFDQKGISYKNNIALLNGTDYSPYFDSFSIKRVVQFNQQLSYDDDFKFINVTNFNFTKVDAQNIIQQQIYLESKEIKTQLTYLLELELTIDNQIVYIPTNKQNLSQLSLANYTSFDSNLQPYLDLTSLPNWSSSFYLMINFPKFEQGILDKISLKIMTQTVNFFPYQNQYCSDGQVYKNNICQFCDDFKVAQRNVKEQQTQCTICDSDKLSKCYAYKSIVKEKHIRYGEFDLNDAIYECIFAPDNCEGGVLYGDSNCKLSHVGPECLESDIKNSRGNGTFVRTNAFNSQECHNYSFNLAFFIIQFIVGLIVIGVLYKIINQLMKENIIQSQLLSDQHIIQQQRFGLNTESCLQSQSVLQIEDESHFESKEQQNLGSLAYFKLLVFYLQIIYVCSFYQMNGMFLSDLFQFQINLYNPFIGSYFSYFKCFLTQQYPYSFSPSQVQTAILAFFPLIFLLLFCLFKLSFHTACFVSKYIQCKVNKNKSDAQKKLINQNQNEGEQEIQEEEKIMLKCFEKQDYKNFPQLILFTFSVLSIHSIENLLQGTICRSFTGYGYVTLNDLKLFCDNSEFQKLKNIFYINFMIFYFSLSFGTIFYFVYLKYKHDKQNAKKLFYHPSFAFLFQEYHESTIFWEYARNFTRIMIVLVIYVMIPSNNSIGFYIIFVLVIYYFLLAHFKPYKNIEYYNQEIIIIWSGVILIFLYNWNSASYFQGKTPIVFTQIIILLGNLWSFILFLYLSYQFIKHLYYKQFQAIKRRCQNFRS